MVASGACQSDNSQQRVHSIDFEQINLNNIKQQQAKTGLVEVQHIIERKLRT